ncbi:FAD-dependent oxidoreductase [Pseudogracilibacillus auburnensis]|uniref:FAD-dependent oxidoreductase n=1 Tax=Pseudogracilibacillus auburnensis TaxID=1494959 RepID=UPI001A97CF14|nr:FAD-dependent oxidoreductase [Pseudogracilibacillus auburnensis]MBO1001364.1 FAD-dependent oxidoreductase [Pseudogracilibacillus auburnensis]
MKKFDVIIIGSGTAGAKIATECAKRKKTVALIEKDHHIFGGSCINIACIPTKTLIHDSLHDSLYEEAVERKNKLVKKMSENKYKSLYGLDQLSIYDGEARFVANKEVEIVTNSTKEIVTAEHIIINTGAVNNTPPIEGIEHVKNVYTSTSLINSEELPDKLVIIGGGYIGLEYASMYASFGSDVTVVMPEDTLIPNEEPEIAQEVEKVLKDKGITFLFGKQVEKVKEENGVISLQLSNEDEVKGDAVLIATGRKPNVEDLHLENTKIMLTDEKAIQVNDKLQTTVDNVWAVGDVKGGMQFTYISFDDARIIINQLFGDKTYSMKKRNNVPYTVFVDPPLSRVGHTKESAEKDGYEVVVNNMPVSSIPRSHIMNDQRGLFTGIVDKQTGQVLGASLFGHSSEELINIVKIAIDHKWLYTDLRDHIFNHPVMSESLNNLFDLEIEK